MAAAKTKNKKFMAYTVLLAVFGVIFMFLYSGLQNDHINIIQTFITEEGGGWDANATMLPVTAGNFATIILTFLYGTLLIKFGVRKTMIPIVTIGIIGCIGLVLAGGLDCDVTEGSYPLYFISLFLIRSCCTIFQMGSAMLVTSWFIKLRGRIMGIMTIGSPLFSVVCTAQMTKIIAKHLDGNYRPFYIGLAILMAIIVITLIFFIKDTPEDAGLFPDGADCAPEVVAADDIKLSVGEVLKSAKAWLLIVSFGTFSFTLIACMATVALRYTTLGGEELWLKATTWLSVGALCGIPVAFAYGWLNDKIGSVKASLIVGCTTLIPPLMLMLMPASGSVPMMIIWGFGVACMTGGVPTLNPCIITYIYGRRRFQAANRVIFAIELIPTAVGSLMMTAFIKAGMARTAYIILLAATVLGIIATILLLKYPDRSKE